MTTVEIRGQLVEAPQTACDPGGFPSTTTVVPFVSNPPQKQVGASTGRKLLTISSPGTFLTLWGAGGEQDVQQAGTIYARVATGGFQARITFANAASPGSPIVSVIPLAGTLLLEPDAPGGYYATKFEIAGAGQVEFYASGAS